MCIFYNIKGPQNEIIVKRKLRSWNIKYKNTFLILEIKNNSSKTYITKCKIKFKLHMACERRDKKKMSNKL